MGYSQSTNLRNIIWRLKELNKDPFFRNDVRKAIMLEVGLDERTFQKYWKTLRFLKLIKVKYGAVCTFGEESI